MTELVSVGRLVRTVATLTGDTETMLNARLKTSDVRTALNAPRCSTRDTSSPKARQAMPLIGRPSPKGDPRIAQYLPLCRSLAFRYVRSCGGYFDLDDLISIGLRAVWQACSSWRAEAGASFTTYVTHYIRGAMTNAVKYTRRGRRIPARDLLSISPLTAEDGFWDLRSDGRSPEDIACERADQDVVAGLMCGLSERQKLVVQRRSCGATLEEIGGELGVTRERARQLEAEAMGKMRRVAGRRRE